MKNAKTGQIGGFTLVELLVVVLIIGILASVALPLYQRAVAKSKLANTYPLARSIVNAQELFYLARGRYASSIQQLDIDKPGECNICYSYGNESLCCGKDFLISMNYGARGALAAFYCPGLAQSADSGDCYYRGAKMVYHIYYQHTAYTGNEGKKRCSGSDKFLCKSFCDVFGC